MIQNLLLFLETWKIKYKDLSLIIEICQKGDISKNIIDLYMCVISIMFGEKILCKKLNATKLLLHYGYKFSK